jgi:uncharacterized protein YdeI (YjbR/CyaY-like superfamily)
VPTKAPVPKSKLLHVTTRAAWRAWLKAHYKSRTEIWLVYYRKSSGKPRLAYNDAVEEALCFGWIDSIVRSIDAARFAQRFSVRKPGSRYSQANLERLRALVRRRRVMRDVLPTLPDLSQAEFKIPADILRAIRANRKAWKHFRDFSPAYVRIRIAYIDGARRRPAEFRKRLAHFVRETEANRQFGFGGIDKHY